MHKLRLLLPFAAVICLASTLTAPASAAPVPAFFQQDSLKEVFLASSLTAKLPTKCGAYCDLSEGGTSPTATAIGTSCAIATSNLSAQLQSYANSFCGSGCRVVVTTTVACHAVSGGFSISGYATFGCRDSTC